MHRFIPAFCLAALLTGTFGGAYLLVQKAMERALFAQRITYSRHFTPPPASDGLEQVLGYSLPDIRASNASVPRTFLARLPSGIGDVAETSEKKRVFIASLLPLILRANELIEQDRERLISLISRRERGAHLSPMERRWVREIAQRYGMKDIHSVRDIDFDILLRRVDKIPPSLALAQAAIESGWGTSRFAREGNALYGQWTWSNSHKGIVPEGREEGLRHRVRAFDYLIDSIRVYMLNLNRNPVYTDLRLRRASLKAEERPITGQALAPTLIQYSERREAYVHDVKQVIRGNNLEDFDHLNLAPSRPGYSIANIGSTDAKGTCSLALSKMLMPSNCESESTTTAKTSD